MRHIFLIFIILICLQIRAQETQKELPRISIRSDMGIPKVIGSQAFRTSFLGIYEFNFSTNIRIAKNYFVGIGYKDALLRTQDYFKKLNVNTKMQSHNGYIRIGFDRFYAENSFATFSINSGYNFSKYTGTVLKNDTLAHSYPAQFTGAFIEPEIGMYILLDPNFAIGAHISYYYNTTKYDPTLPYLTHWRDFDKLKNNAGMNWLTFGFGFYYGFVRKK